MTRNIGIAIWLFILMISLRLPAAAAESGIIFIVNPANPMTRISGSDLRDYYFKRKRVWPDGTGVRFIDRATGAPIRKSFLSNYLHKRPNEIDLFWIGQKLYSGDSAPLQAASDLAVLQFVGAFPGAIGYVSSSAPLGSFKVKQIVVDP